MILITGASGFIGSALLSLAVDRYGKENVLALTSQPTDLCSYILHGNYTFQPSELQSYPVTEVIHAGSFIPKTNSVNNSVLDCNSNIYNTYYLLSTLPSSLRKIVFLSTVDVYAPSNECISEESTVKPISLYGWSKLYCEQLVASWCQSKNILFSNLRLGHIYGEGEGSFKKLIPRTIKRVLSNEAPIVFGAGSETRAFLYVGDCCDLILKSLTIELPDNLVNIVSDESHSIKSIIEKIIKLSDATVQPEYKGSLTAPRSLSFNAERLHQYLGFPRTPFEEGLLKEVNYFRQLLP